MLLRASISGQIIPRLNSNAISDYSLKIVDVLRDPIRSDEACKQAADFLGNALLKFGTRSGERNPPHRLRAFTDRLIEDLLSGKPVLDVRQSENSVSLGAVESGRIIWFDELKNYGFIDRDIGGDIFVHESEISRIPWHLRNANKRVQYQVLPNPKSPGMLMASEVCLETN